MNFLHDFVGCPHWCIRRALLLLLLLPSPSIADGDQIRFDHRTINDGLSQSTVLSIAQDQRGFMWFATMDGLNRYDGYVFTIHRHDPLDSNSISGLGIRRLYVDRRGRLWIVTFHGKVDRYDPGREVFVHYRLAFDDTTEPLGSRVYGICEDKAGNLWIGTGSGWFYRLDQEHDRFVRQTTLTHDPLLPGDNRVRCMRADEAGGFWVGTTAGLLHYDPGAGTTVSVPIMRNSRNAKHEPEITALAGDRTGDLWIATATQGLYVRDRKQGSIKSYRYDVHTPDGLGSDRIASLFVDSRSAIWVGTADAGLDMIQPHRSDVHHYRTIQGDHWSLSSGEVLSVCEDQSGGLWFGMSSSGVNHFQHRQSFEWTVHRAGDAGSLRCNDIWSLCMDHEGVLWVGTDGGGLSRRLRGHAGFEHYLEKPHNSLSNSVTAVYEDRRGIVWIGNDAGAQSVPAILTFDRASRSCVPFRHIPQGMGGVASFCEDSLGDVWIGTLRDGVWRYNLAQGSMRCYRHGDGDPRSISGNSVIALFMDRTGVLWLGTQGSGVNRYDRGTNSFTSYHCDPADTTTLSNNTVWCFAEDSAGDLWMGTWGGGLNKFQRGTNRFERFTVDHGLPSNIVNAIQPDHSGNIWLSTNRGLSRFNTRTYACKNYDYTDGLPGNEFSNGASCAGQDGRLYFGGNSGVVSLHPDSLEDNPHIPPVVLTGFNVFDRPAAVGSALESGREITLSYKQNFFSFEFAALDYAAPEKNQYAYMLEGVDKNWVHVGTRRYASYTDIEPGKYRFRVKGSNNDAVWNDQEAVIALVVTPPVWQTWWFKAAVVLCLAGLGLAGHRYRLNKLLEVERTRNRIARDLHDEVSGTVTGIVYFADAMAREIGDRGTPGLEKLLSLINESATSVQESMSDIIWSVTPENDRWETILPRFRRYASDLCESKGIRHHIEIPSTLDARTMLMEHRRNLWLIYKEIVTNAVKHSGCSELSIAISYDQKQLHLAIVDNGKGFDPGRQSDRHGLRNIRTRVTALKGQAALNTAPGEGTRWNLTIPL